MRNSYQVSHVILIYTVGEELATEPKLRFYFGIELHDLCNFSADSSLKWAWSWDNAIQICSNEMSI